MLKIEEVLRNNTYIRNDSIEFWFSHFYKDCCGSSVTYCDDYLDWYGEHNCYDEIGFKRRLFMFLQENPFYAVDMKFNISLGEKKVQKIREITFIYKKICKKRCNLTRQCNVLFVSNQSLKSTFI